MVASAVKGAWCSNDEVGGDDTAFLERRAHVASQETARGKSRTGLTLNHPPAILPSLLCEGLGLLQLRNLRSPPLAGLVSREATAPVGRVPVFQDLLQVLSQTPTQPLSTGWRSLPCPV